ncbi:MAG: histidine kinase [Flavobacteriales bacterium]|nr:histidine kinase [Flavobacteriales bacterium]MBK9286835.1 histidine kinase [Flavobacteriales bacterium]MBL0035322.1 histidine kinase [Flavobacteriales bacterium]
MQSRSWERTWACLGLVFLTIGVTAQHRPYRHYDVEHGLAGSTVYCVQQDSAGYLWFGTAAGLSRFDGTTFTNFTTNDGLPSNEVLGLVLDQFGRLWVQTFQGPLCFLKDGIFHTPTNDRSLNKLATSAAALGIKPDPAAGDVKVVSSEGTYRYTGEALIPLPLPEGTNGLYWIRTVGTDLWALNREGLHRRLPGKPWERVMSEGSREIPAIQHVADLGDEVLIHTGPELLRISFTDQQARVAQRVAFTYGLNRASLDRVGGLWVCTPANGVFRFATNNIMSDVPERFAPSASVAQCIMDQEGVLWFASHIDGVFKLVSVHDQLFDVSDGLSSNDLHCVVADGPGAVQVGTGELTIDRVRPGAIANIFGTSPKGGVRVLRAVSNGRDRIFISDAGLLRSDELGGITHWPQFGASKALIMDSNGELLIGTSSAVYHASPANGEVLDTLVDERCTALLKDARGALLMGTLNGLRMIGADTVGYDRLIDALAGVRVTDMLLCANGTLVVGTHGKGILLQSADGALSWLTAEQDGLSSNICGRLREDDSGRLWICTARGLDRLVAEGGMWRVRNFTMADGLPDNEVRDVLVRGDSLWIATHKGLFMLGRAGDMEKDDFPMRITGIRFNGNDTLLTGRYTVPYDRNDISIAFIAFHMRSDGRITYRYRLAEGALWRYTTANMITIPRATPGTYAVSIQARTAGGTWGAQVARITIEVETPWWQRPWALGGILAALLAGAWAIFQRRQARLVRASRERERNARAMAELELQAHRARIDPHFVFNCLNSIQGFVINEDNDKAHRYIAQFASYIRRTLRVARLNFIPLREEIEMLREQTGLEMMRTRQAFTTRIEVDADMSLDTELPTMLLQTFVENAIKHGLNPLRDRAGELGIRFSKSGDGLVCTITDNGVGLNHSAPKGAQQNEHTSEGLNLVKERIKLFNTQFGMDIRMRLDPGIGGLGTMVRVTIPVERTNTSVT